MEERNRDNDIALFVREHRKKANLTQVELADISGVGLRFLRELEQGKTNLMTDKINQVLLFLGGELTVKSISDETRRSMG